MVSLAFQRSAARQNIIKSVLLSRSLCDLRLVGIIYVPKDKKKKAVTGRRREKHQEVERRETMAQTLL